jgi:hypothetical protein
VRLRISLGLLAISGLLAGCGRVGFESHTLGQRDAEPPGDGPDDMAQDAGRDAAQGDGAGDPSKNKPPESADGGYRPVDPGEAGLPAPDAGAAPDAGTDAGGAPSFSCSSYADSLGCSSFDDPSSDDVYLNHTSGEGDVWIQDGVLHANTEGASADAYAGVDFPRLYSGDLYLQLHVIFPSSGDLTSVNFVTLGNYNDSSDYGVELDVIEGKLAFNSSSDGFVYGDHRVPRDQWLCMHAHVRLGNSSGSLTLDVDGSRVLSVSDWDTVPSDGTRVLHVGIDWTRRYQQSGRVRVDGFVLARRPVPCP